VETRSTAPGRRHYLVIFREAPGAADLEQLKAGGAVITGSAPDTGVMVSAPEGTAFDPEKVEWAGTLEADDKLSPLLVENQTGVYLVSFHADVDMTLARAVVESTGLLVREHPDLLAWQLLAAGPLDVLAGLAAWDDVAYIMPASTELAAGEHVVGCAGALTAAGPIGEYVLASSGWPRIAGSVTLKYVLSSLASRLPASTSRTEIVRAYGEWARYANVNFQEGTDPNGARTIAVKFARGAHGDAYPFDGPGRVLAHTFYPAPPNQEPLAGDMHFDDDEAWQTGGTLDLFSVALHEAGHALGLGHTDRPGTVMYPYYKLTTGLTSDDIAGVRALYGTRDAVGTPAPTPTPVPTPAPIPAPPKPPPAAPSPSPTPGDTTPPSLQFTYPAYSTLSVSSPMVTVRGTASDSTGVTRVTWSSSTGGSGTAAGTTAWSANVPLLIGNNVITVRAYDAAGNNSWRAVTIVRR
jgi:hypothetical protein